MSLFDNTPLRPASIAKRPLAERMRPATLAEYVGQEHILGAGKPLRLQIDRDQLTSLILWGPPGVGKTTLARLIAQTTKADFVPFSAVLGGIKEIKAVMADAERNSKAGRRTLLFVDEIHRFNKAQQDAFLPYVERGDITLIGATTENPSFEIISALLSRTRVYALKSLELSDVVVLLRRALETDLRVSSPEALLQQIAMHSNGDGRTAYNLLELAAAGAVDGEITPGGVADVLERKTLLYDKSGEEHFNLISAMHKSIRSSDADAAVYWLGRMLQAGEDRLYLARRLMRIAIEDVGLADPRALEQAVAAKDCVHFLGSPEGELALVQLAIYLAFAPKSDAAYLALQKVQAQLQEGPVPPVPLHLRNAPTKPMKEWGYGVGYQHAHRFEGALTDMTCLPDELKGTPFYEPADRGFEKRLRERQREIQEARHGTQDSSGKT